MTGTRPLMQYGIRQLEEIFAAAKADREVLRQLEHELQYRQVPRAVALLSEVQAAIYPAAPDATADVAPALPPKAPVPSNSEGELLRSPILGAAVSAPIARSIKQASSAIAETPPMPLDEAYRVLKATPASTWESIEQVRRQVVQQASPASKALLTADKRTQAQSDAQRANAAYATLAHHRTAAH